MDDESDHAPDLKIESGRDVDGRVVAICGEQRDDSAALEQLFHQQFAVQGRDDNVSVLGIEGAIHHQQISTPDDGTHSFALGSDEVRRSRMLDQKALKIQRGFNVIVCG